MKKALEKLRELFLIMYNWHFTAELELKEFDDYNHNAFLIAWSAQN